MKNFIKAHPYWSCTGLALATNTLGVFLTKDHIIKTQTKQPIGFIPGFLCLGILTTIPSMLITAIDQYGFQNLTESKPLQYTLTAVESVVAAPSVFICSLVNDDKSFTERFTGYFKNLINPDFSDQDSVEAKVLTASSLIQSLGFKYILDLANEQSQGEIDLEIDDLITNNESLQNDYAEGL